LKSNGMCLIFIAIIRFDYFFHKQETKTRFQYLTNTNNSETF